MNPNELWTNRAASDIAEALQQAGFNVCANTVDKLLRDELGLGRRQAVKDVCLGQSPDRDAQFQRIAELRAYYSCWDLPVISVDTKKKEQLGNFHRHGACRTNGIVHTLDHDFATAGTGKIIPYGVYDVRANEGFMMLAQGSDTGELACDAIRMWWDCMGRTRHGGVKRMLVLADAGGSNGCRNYLFRQKLWELSCELGASIRVAHLPSYCSKYNPIDHRMFSHVSRFLKGVIFRSIESIHQAIAKTKTSTGLHVAVRLAEKVYERGVKATEDFLTGDCIRYDDHLPQYNYQTIRFR